MFKIIKLHLYFIRYHLKDVIVGKIYFLLVRIKIKHMEIDIIKRETTGTGPSVYHENDTIAKYEIMDGAPVRGKAHVCTACHSTPEASLLMPLRLRRVHSHPVVPGWLRPDPHDARHQQEVLGALLPEPGADRRRGEALLQATGERRRLVRRSLADVFVFIFPSVCTSSSFQEITLWRKGDVVRKSMSHQAVVAAQRFEGSAASESALEQAAKEESG